MINNIFKTFIRGNFMTWQENLYLEKSMNFLQEQSNNSSIGHVPTDYLAYIGRVHIDDIFLRGEFYQHFTCTFCANIFAQKKITKPKCN